MLDNVLDITKELIKVKSDPGNKKELGTCLDICLSHLQDFTIEEFEKDDIRSVLIHNQAKRPKKFKIILNGHLDIIPGKDEQYKPVVKGDRLYGVGSMDMKSNVVCMMLAFKEVAEKVDYPLALQLVTDEEVGGFKGTKYQIDEGVNADFVISGETTNFDIVNKAKGILWAKATCSGKTAHGAYPWRGENAILKMNSFLEKLFQKYPTPHEEKWLTTVNLSKIETSNNTFNKVPDDCSVSLDIRFIPEDVQQILSSVKKLMPRGFEFEVIAEEAPLNVSEKNKYIKELIKISKEATKKDVILYNAQGSSDARHFSKVGCDGIEFGPIGGGIGSDKEWVDIPSLETYLKILKSFLLSSELNTL